MRLQVLKLKSSDVYPLLTIIYNKHFLVLEMMMLQLNIQVKVDNKTNFLNTTKYFQWAIKWTLSNQIKIF